MRTTVTFDADTAAAIERRRLDSGKGVSTVVNALIREGLAAPRSPSQRFEQASADLGLRLDVRNVWEALDRVDEPGLA